MAKVIGIAAGLVLGVAVVAPSLVGAQTPGNALLSVYVQVNNPSYIYGGTPSRNPGDFNVIVAGQSVSQPTFFGSQTGTQVSLGTGTYSVAVTGNTYGFTPDYSQGCNGSVAGGQTALCIITMNPQYSNYQYPAPYPYPYLTPSLGCSPAHQTVGLNQNASFQAVGGVGGTYNWRIPSRNYPNVGPVLTVSFDNSGSQLVTVTNGAQSATCEVTVTNTYYPTPVSTNTIYPYGGSYGCTSCTIPNYTYTNPCNCNAPVVTSTYIPRLPNTGVEPLTAVQLSLALTLLAGVALFAAPYVRKAFAVATR